MIVEIKTDNIESIRHQNGYYEIVGVSGQTYNVEKYPLRSSDVEWITIKTYPKQRDSTGPQ